MALNFQKILSAIQFNDPNSVAAFDLTRQLASESKGRKLSLARHAVNIGTPGPSRLS